MFRWRAEIDPRIPRKSRKNRPSVANVGNLDALLAPAVTRAIE
jgi:hypothetical protein